MLFRSDYASAYSNKGQAHQELNQHDVAITCYEKAIDLNPDFAEAYSNLGIAQQELKQYDAAIKSFRKAINIDPSYAAPYSNLGVTLQELNQLNEAISNYEKAINLKNDYAQALWNKALAKILLGEYEEGWQLYEWRWKSGQKDTFRNFKEPLWLGQEPIKDKVILIHAEQGLGDSIQFCRYISMVESLGPKQILLEVPMVLMTFLSSLNVRFNLIEQGHSIPKFDLQCPMMSLPYAFKTNLNNIPAAIPYLYADKEKTKYWANKLGIKTAPRVGLVWSGSTGHKNDHNRSLLLKQLAPLFELEFEFHCLQKEIRPVDLDAMNNLKAIHLHEDDLIDFSDTAALVENLDLVITVDTSVAHLAGAMGKKVFILLPFAPDYRWMLDTNESPWYPTATLIRQPNLDDWNHVIKQLKLILISLIEK